ncbi:MAG: S9 family peptidase [Cyanobium sp.]
MEAAGQGPAAGEATPPAAPVSAALPAAWVVDATPVLKEPGLQGERLFWLEQLPAERGRTTLRLRDADGLTRDLTPSLDLRSRIHGYGGGTWTVCGDTVVVVADGGRSLWRLDLPDTGMAGTSLQSPAPVRLLHEHDPAAGTTEPGEADGAAEPDGTPEPDGAVYADGLIDPWRQRWIGVCERNGSDHLVAVPLAGGTAVTLHDSPDFCGYAALSPDGSHLAWVSWQQPCMPWDRSQLWLGRLTDEGSLLDVRPVAGSAPDAGPALSVFQPLWAGTSLVVANDRSGWWNLEVLEAATSLEPEATPHWRALLPPLQAEFAMPQWVYGMRTTAWDGRCLVAAACRQGIWELGTLTLPPAAAPRPAGSDTPAGSAAAAVHDPPAGTSAALGAAPLLWQPISLPFNDLAALTAQNGRVVAIASGPVHGPGLLELQLPSGRWSHHPAAPARLAAAAISRAEPLWFSGHGGRRTHAWYYPPSSGSRQPAPLLIKGHSGPTAMARPGLSLAIQFWTSRVCGVVDVNYGGSTGFGRAYRERLDGQWGVVDVDDCLAAAEALVSAGRADPARIAMEGSSASGFTVLAALARGDTIRAGACRYPVTDLTALAEGDHRFEARYFDALVGPWPAARALYEERSPLQQLERLQAPLLLFHGLDDAVVPPQQSEVLAERLRQRGVPVELHLFPGEGHGFRDAAVQLQVLERTEAFFQQRFQRSEATR